MNNLSKKLVSNWFPKYTLSYFILFCAEKNAHLIKTFGTKDI